MNLLKLTFLLVLIIGFTSCASDDDTTVPTCTQANWVGDYTGTQTCDGVTEDVTVSITASGADAVIVMYEVPGVETEFDPMTPDGCDIDKTDSGNGITLTVDASLDGDNLSFQDILVSGGATITCTITATRN